MMQRSGSSKRYGLVLVKPLCISEDKFRPWLAAFEARVRIRAHVLGRICRTAQDVESHPAIVALLDKSQFDRPQLGQTNQSREKGPSRDISHARGSWSGRLVHTLGVRTV